MGDGITCNPVFHRLPAPQAVMEALARQDLLLIGHEISEDRGASEWHHRLGSVGLGSTVLGVHPRASLDTSYALAFTGMHSLAVPIVPYSIVGYVWHPAAAAAAAHAAATLPWQLRLQWAPASDFPSAPYICIYIYA